MDITNLIITESGEQILTRGPEGVKMGVVSHDDPVASEVKLNVTDAEYKQLAEDVATNSITDDTIKAKVVST